MGTMSIAAGGRGFKGRRRKADPEAKRKAEEMHRTGVPFQMAMAIAHGKLDLNEALSRMAQKEQVNRLIERHELSRAVATQVVLGQVDLEMVLSRRRLDQHREAHRDATCLQVGRELALAIAGRKKLVVRVEALTPYAVTVQEQGGARLELHKLQIKYAYAPDDWKRVRKVLGNNKEVAALGLSVAERPQDRYSCSDRRLFGFIERQREVEVTFLEGDVVTGQVSWFSRYEFGLKAKGGGELVAFRHALHSVEG